jgi:hypothetical protein
MTWIFLRRYWKQLVGAALVALLLGTAYGWAYGRGVAATEAHYQPLLLAAEFAKARAEERTRSIEEASKRLTAQQEARHAEALRDLDVRAAGAEQRFADLLRKRAACPRRGEVPAVPGTAADTDAASTERERARRAGERLADVGRGCEADAIALTQLQEWIRSQQALN